MEGGYSAVNLANYLPNSSRKSRSIDPFPKIVRIALKLVFFYDLPACNKKAEVLSLATVLISNLRSQFNHVFPILISMPRFKA